MIPGLPRRAFAWYGDDFTGSTDVLEAMAPHMPSVLFLERPSASQFAPFAGHAAFGLAGSSRGETPEWMDAHLPEAFGWLKELGASVCLYKVCSTFDSSPGIGNIGRAMETGRRVFGSRFVPIVAGAPSLRRYTFFGHLFAAGGDGGVHRIDRHPGMMRHPVTPMDESDLRLHLARQTSLRIGLVDAITLESGATDARYRDEAGGHDAVLIDVARQGALAAAGRLLWEEDRQPFIAGSSGAAYALIAHWTRGQAHEAAARPVPPVDQIAVLSGSLSPVTAGQIEYAGGQGYALIPIPVRDASIDDEASAANARDEACASRAIAAIGAGAPGVVLYTAFRAGDRVENLSPEARRRLGERGGRILHRVIAATGLRRTIIAGGDTASYAARQLGITALTFAAHMAPGAPLCRAWPGELHIILKGGQCGRPDFFETVRKGIPE